MVKILSLPEVVKLINAHTLDRFIFDLVDVLKKDFSNWHEFHKIPRPSFNSSKGVIELMPIADKELFAYKCVNSHPDNPLYNKQTVIATGQLAKMSDGHPVLISEMTLLTAIRTAAVTALATSFLAKTNSRVLGLIGTGAQSDFQAVALGLINGVKIIRFFDIDPNTMNRFKENMQAYDFELIPCGDAKEVVDGSDIVTVCTTCIGSDVVIKNSWVKQGVHINALGGDCPGKIELEKSILNRSKIVVEFFEQSCIEGEVQQFNKEEAKDIVYAELWELCKNEKTGRFNDNEITVFDSVGFASEDLSVLKLTYELAHKYNIGSDIQIIPKLDSPKNLFSVIL